MKKKTFYLLLLLLIVFVSVYQMASIQQLSESEKITNDTNTIVAHFLENENEATRLFVGKTLVVEGIIQKISFLNDEKTLFLKTNYSDVYVICELHSKEKKENTLKINEKIKIEGTCKGFLKDVILLNCKIIIND